MEKFLSCEKRLTGFLFFFFYSKVERGIRISVMEQVME